MSLYGALFSGVSALSAQSQSMAMISDNIANVNTIGYKRTEAAFSDLVTSQTSSTAYASGGVTSTTIQHVDQQGVLQQSTSSTDIALSGSGFFVVKNSISDDLQPASYTRAGQFSENDAGYLVSPSGSYLMGWPVDANGNIPSGNGDLSSLKPVDVAFLGGITRQTTTANLSINLNASEVPYVYPLSTPVTQKADFSRAFTAFDSLGQSQDITMNFYHVTSPTATSAGNVDIEGTSDLMDSFPSLASTATMTGSVAIPAPGTLASVAPGLTNGDSFNITLGGQSAAIVVNPNWTQSDLAAAINSAFSTSPASVVGDKLVLTANTPITVSAGGAQPITAANLNAMGLDFTTQNRDPKTFTLQTGGGAAETVTINDGDSAADLVSKINALPDVNAQFDADGKIVIAADNSGQTLTLAGANGGGNEISTAGLASLGLAAGVSTPPAAPNLLTQLGTAANPQNWWQVSFTAPDGTVMSSGMVNFNGDGSINSDTKPATISLSNISWGNGSSPQNISLDISNLNQYSGDYNVISVDQNGAALGLRNGVSIDSDGYVVASFTNGQSTKLYKLPVATFADPNGLTAQNGNTFSQSNESGEYNLREAGAGSAGTIQSSSLEASNVDMADEFSKMIVTQRAYTAGTKVITTADQMLQDLLQLR
jgi:flagellar hook protein FlgE